MGTKYICRDYILEEIDEIIGNINFSSPYQNDNDLIVSGLERARDVIYNADIKDVVEVVRCKDCKYRGDYGCPMYSEEYIDTWDDGYHEFECVEHDNTHDEGFCDRGERKEDEYD